MTQVRCPKCFEKFGIELSELPLRDPIKCECGAQVKITVAAVMQHPKPVQPSRAALAQVAA